MIRNFLTATLILLTSLTYGQFQIDTLNYNGPNAVNFVIVGDGYTANQQGTFINRANRILSVLNSEEPFASEMTRINVFAIRVISNESGVSNAINGTVVDNYFNTTLGHLGFDRALAVVDTTLLRTTLENHIPEYDLPIVIGNTSTYSGWGTIEGEAFRYAACGGFGGVHDYWIPHVALHEVGHAFANLADEYIDTTFIPLISSFGNLNWNGPNVTPDTLMMPKWSEYLSHPDVGYFEGALYHETGWYRSSAACKMRAVWEPFCVVCSAIIVDEIDRRLTVTPPCVGDTVTLTDTITITDTINTVDTITLTDTINTVDTVVLTDSITAFCYINTTTEITVSDIILDYNCLTYVYDTTTTVDTICTPCSSNEGQSERPAMQMTDRSMPKVNTVINTQFTLEIYTLDGRLVHSARNAEFIDFNREGTYLYTVKYDNGEYLSQIISNVR